MHDDIAMPDHAHAHMATDLALIHDLLGGRSAMRRAGGKWLPRLRGFRKMRAALHCHDYEEADTEAQDSKWAHQTGHRATHITALLRRAAQH